MKSLKYLGIVLMVWVGSSCSNPNENENTQVADPIEEREYPVTVQKIEKQEIEKTLEYTANLAAFREIHYAPASPGRIEKINVEVGSRVTEGQVLVETDRTQLTQALTQLENARVNFQRIDTLNQLGSISEQQYDQMKTQYDLAQSNVDFLEENTRLLSPVNGIVTGKYFEEGEMYSGAPNTAAGKAAVISLMQINPLKAVVSVSQSYFPVLYRGMEADIRTGIYSDRVFSGKISKVYPVIDQSTRTFKVEVIVQNNKEELRPGMFVDVDFKISQADVLVVPAIAVLKQEGTNNRYVFVNDGGIAKKIEVMMGKRFDDMVEVQANGLDEGMELIIEGQANLLDGSKLRIASK